MLAPFIVHGIEIWRWTSRDVEIGVMQTLEAAVLLSTTINSSINLGDTETAQAWRLVRAMKGINLVLIFAWSKTVLARVRK